MPRSSPYAINLTRKERAVLEQSSRNYTSAYYKVFRAKIILLCAQGLQNKEVAARLDAPRQIVSKWRKRFFHERLAGLTDRSRGGRPPTEIAGVRKNDVD
jgi:transposase-like protein